MQDSELSFDADIVTGEAVEVGKDGAVAAFVDGKEVHGNGLEAVKAEHAQMLNGHAINEKSFVGGLRLVERDE
jgi:hypothetical protein